MPFRDKYRKILILGSAPDAVEAADRDVSVFDAVVAINNAWRITPGWTHSIFPSDFPIEKHPMASSDQSLHSADEYVPAQNEFGGFVYAGGTMAFTAAYWSLFTFRPDVIAFLGCDMVYSGANTHFYGRGTADPLRVDPTLRNLEAKATRFGALGQRAGCRTFNLSSQPESRLTFPRITFEDIASSNYPGSKEYNSTVVETALAKERTLDYFVESGKYWKETERFDVEEIDRLDQLWLDCAR